MPTLQTKSEFLDNHDKRIELPSFDSVLSEELLRASYLSDPVLGKIQRQRVAALATSIVNQARISKSIFSVETLLSAYSLSASEGRILMELAEALLRVPDPATRNFLIRDKLESGSWMGADSTGFVTGAKYALHLSGCVSKMNNIGGLKSVIARLGWPTICRAVRYAMRCLGDQFVISETLDDAIASVKASNGLYSLDMLGEGARTENDAGRYFRAYEIAIQKLGKVARNDDPNLNNGISIKLSALHCRFQTRYSQECIPEITVLLHQLIRLAQLHNIPVTIDAEEAARLQLTLAIFGRLLSEADIADWPGLGIVVQAYDRRAGLVIDWLEKVARKNKTRIPIRLVKGAYWDTEIKIAQEKGLSNFPVFTIKQNTELAYLAHVRRLLTSSRWFYPQFATHNASTLASIAVMTDDVDICSYEIQKLHGMGTAVHRAFSSVSVHRLRTYAPVGPHGDLLAYLVRRLLENGANSSFVNKLANKKVSIDDLVRDPYVLSPSEVTVGLESGVNLYWPSRRNSAGIDIDEANQLMKLRECLIRAELPTQPENILMEDIKAAFSIAKKAVKSWQKRSNNDRSEILDRIADSYETNAHPIIQLLVLEGGKTFDDAISELREAVDFCRYYASEARSLGKGGRARGVIVTISPWNFPLAIFSGQIVAALVTGNCVIAKPASQTPRIAKLAIDLMHFAGIPNDVLHLLIGEGKCIGHAICAVGEADMVVFTGSTETAKKIELSIAKSTKPAAPLIAETGGLNAMIIDSSALVERAVDDVITSAFRSSGQRCSSLRMLYVQEDIAEQLLKMLIGAADKLKIGSPKEVTVDVGPLIDSVAKNDVDHYINEARRDGRLIWQKDNEITGTYCNPCIIRLNGIFELEKEVFGPVLHFSTFKAGEELKVVDDINSKGYGLTFGMHSRIDENIERVSKAISVGNIYINRNQVGSIVGSQPFGGMDLSGTGPKAGGPNYLKIFMKTLPGTLEYEEKFLCPGPDGELNFTLLQPRGRVLCIHPDNKELSIMKRWANLAQNDVNCVSMAPEKLENFDAVMVKEDGKLDLGAIRLTLARSSKKLIPLISDFGGLVWLWREKHICRDLTATGGNIDLLTRH